LDRPYRVGGDEFALIMPDTLAPEAHLVLDRLRQAVAEAIEGVTISVGISTSDRGDVPATRIRDQADTALYEAKHRGKNQVATYTLLLDDGGNFTATKIQAIRQMLADSAVTMWFQPIFRVGSDKVLAFEALLRLPGSPEVSGPEEAFDIALQIGRSYELDLLCVRGALDVAQRLPADSKMFINLDPATLMHSDFSVAELVRLVEERDIDPTKVVFEVTEKTHVPLTRLAKQVEALHGCGFGVALDDVGAGNSGLEMLRLMTFDYVKIDRSVILDAMNGGPGRAIILAIVAFARETGAFMTAEGMESKAMLQAVKLDTRGLSEYWVQGVQGFLFGEPRPSVDSYLNESPKIAEQPRHPSLPPDVRRPLAIGQHK
jgi:EAL domain-containing protein (putative c-di-GMP-specific phosphodiesterase class I)